MAARRGKSSAEEPDVGAIPEAENTEQVGTQTGESEILRIDVSLPETVHVAPDDELAVALHDHNEVDPLLASEPQGTKSVSFETTDFAKQLELEREAAYASGAESSAMLTAERLVGGKKHKKPAPEGRWQEFVYAATFHTVNLGDSPEVQARKALDARISKPFTGGARFVPVLTRKGGVGKTTVTTLLGMALASVREDRVIAIDANPDRGTLAERISKQTRATVRDVVTRASSVSTFSDFSQFVSRDETRLDVLASDTDPMLSEAFDDGDYNVVADIAARFYSIVLTDCGTGIVHSVMRAVLQRADEIVIVSGGSVDEARLASETLTWLESNGYGELVRNSVVVINTATHGTDLVNVDEIETHFSSRVRKVLRIPYDPHIAAGSVIEYSQLHPYTKEAVRELAAHVVEGLSSDRDGDE